MSTQANPVLENSPLSPSLSSFSLSLVPSHSVSLRPNTCDRDTLLDDGVSLSPRLTLVCQLNGRLIYVNRTWTVLCLLLIESIGVPGRGTIPIKAQQDGAQTHTLKGPAWTNYRAINSY